MFQSSRHPKNTEYHFTFLRHAESVGNALGYYQGQSDFPLSETGKQQAHALAARWQREGKTFQLALSSPLQRAHQTAQIVCAALNLPLTLEDQWMERNNGILAGLNAEQAAQTAPPPDMLHPYHPIGKTGESQWEVYLRAGTALQSLLHRQPGNYLIVSHGGFLNTLVYAILGIGIQANFQGPRFRFRNSAFATFTYRPHNHEWIVEAINDHSHWSFNDD
ncbi:MAG: hypothetical protein OHK0052_21000 [Anaerolineales bacterium]